MPRLYGGVLILAEMKVSCHKLPPILAVAVPTGCRREKAIARNLLADSEAAWEPGRERRSLRQQPGGAG